MIFKENYLDTTTAPQDPVIDPNTPDLPEPVDPYPVVDPPADPVPQPDPFPTPPEPIPQYPPDVKF